MGVEGRFSQFSGVEEGPDGGSPFVSLVSVDFHGTTPCKQSRKSKGRERKNLELENPQTRADLSSEATNRQLVRNAEKEARKRNDACEERTNWRDWIASRESESQEVGGESD